MAVANTLLDTIPTPVNISVAGDYAVTVMFFCNLNTPDPLDPAVGREFVDIYVVPSGSSTGNQTKIANKVPIDAGDTFTFGTERLVLEQGDKIYASTTTQNKITLTVSYVLI